MCYGCDLCKKTNAEFSSVNTLLKEKAFAACVETGK